MSMLDHDPNRDLGRDPYANRYSEMSEGSGYAPLIALFAIAVIVGGLFFFSPSSDQTKVAEITRPPSRPLRRRRPHRLRRPRRLCSSNASAYRSGGGPAPAGPLFLRPGRCNLTPTEL